MKRWIRWTPLLWIGAGSVVAGMVLWQRCGLLGCPNVGQLDAHQPGGESVLVDRNGLPLALLSPLEHRVVSLDALPDYVPAAFIAVEDRRFYRHEGVDWLRVVGAALANLRAGSYAEGSSTLTMQLARSVFPERIRMQDKTLRRKLLEVRVAREIEERFSKREILELYLNHLYFGAGVYGIESASRLYFGQGAHELTLEQAGLLAALPRAPAYYDPRRHPDRAQERRDLVLGLMAAEGHITEAEAERARAQDLAVVAESRASAARLNVASYYIQLVRRQLEDELGEGLYGSALRIYTPLDIGAQRAAEEELARQLESVERGNYGRLNAPRYSATQDFDPDGTRYLQGAVVVMEVATGDVLALVGGRNFRHSRFDRATQARRQTGSAFKPFVYATALEQGFSPTQPIADRPLSLPMGDGSMWEPRNFDGEFQDRMPLREALVRSQNVPSIRLAGAVGTGVIAELARRAGVQGEVPRTPAIALGITEVSPLELTAAYSAFAGMGRGVEPRFVLRVEDPSGRVLWEPEVREREVLEPEIAYLLTDMLQDAVDRGTGNAVRQAGFHGPAAGKTGTTDDGSDVWFVGYTPDLVGGLWIGFDERQALPQSATGGTVAAPAWGRLMRRIYDTRPLPEPWSRPDGIIELPVDQASGLVLADGCWSGWGAPERELFVAGEEPATTCPARGGNVLRGLSRLVSGLFGSLLGRRSPAIEEPAPEPQDELLVGLEPDPHLGEPRLPTRREQVEREEADVSGPARYRGRLD